MTALLSSAGSSRLQKDAATMTPAAKPVRIFCRLSEMLFFSTKTIAAPRLVPRNGIRIPKTVSIVMSRVRPLSLKGLPFPD